MSLVLEEEIGWLVVEEMSVWMEKGIENHIIKEGK